jgi:transcriptional regulator with XRE-family HTH domain
MSLADRAIEVRELLSSGRARDLRLRHGLSLEICARDCEVSSAAYFRWERCERSPKGRNLVTLHRFLTRLAERDAAP